MKELTPDTMTEPTYASKEQVLELLRPTALKIAATHKWGPFAARYGQEVELSPTSFALKNTGQKPITLHAFDIDPLHRESDGADVKAVFAVLPEDGSDLSVCLQAGDERRFHLSGRGHLPPGRYQLHLRITDADTNETILIPVTVTVKAHWAWAMGFMFLGLMVVGISALLAGEVKVRERLAEVLTLRQTAHEFLDQYPPLQADRVLVARMDDALVEALKALGKPRPLGIKDDRVQQADHFLSQAKELSKELYSQSKGRTPGLAEVENLEKQWEDLKKRLEAIESLRPSIREITQTDKVKLADLLQVFQQSQWDANLNPLLVAIREQLGPQVERAHLALSAGDGNQARQWAVTTQRWLQRAAHELEQRANILLTWRVYSGEMMIRHQSLTSLLHEPTLPQDSQHEIGTLMEEARKSLANKPSSLQAFSDAYSKLQTAETVALDAWSKTLIGRYKSEMQTVLEKTSLSKIEQASGNLSPDDTSDVRRQKILNRLELWRERVDSCDDPKLRKTLLEKVANLKKFLKGGNLPGIASGLKELFTQWSAYQDVLLDRAKRDIFNPYCYRLELALRDQLKTSGEFLALLQPHQMIAGVEEELDRIRLSLKNVPQGPESLNYLINLNKRLVDADGQLFKAVVYMADVSAQARLTAAEKSEVETAIVLARNLMTEPRPLDIILHTQEDELCLGRQVRLEIDNLSPAWGPGVQVIIDFGDGTPLVRKNAEEIRREAALTHRYDSPDIMRVQVKALMGEKGSDILGEGQRNLNIRPSPISTAQTMAGLFLNLQFFLAVIISLLIQGWRFYGQEVFGSQGKDYLEAFALGFGVNAGIEGLGIINALLK